MIFQRTKLAVCFLGLIFVSLFSSFPARAQNFTVYDLIATVNSLRASQGLSPYEVDAWLMDYAQQHSDYQASINSSTHTHSNGSTSLSIGVMENVANGTASFMTVDFIVNQIWADAVHMKTMVGYSSGTVGAGLATSGDIVYVTLNVKPGDGSVVSAPAQASAIPATAKPLYTSTPAVDGSISHVVGYGEALWSIAIAYGVKIDTLRKLNNLAADSNTIFVGQKLLIIPAGTIVPTQTPKPDASLTPTSTYTPKPPTATSTAFSTSTPTISPTPTKKPLISLSFRPTPRNLGIGIIVIASIALVFIVFFGFIKK